MSIDLSETGIEGVISTALDAIESIAGHVYPAEALKNACAPFVFYEKTQEDEDDALDGGTGLMTAGFVVHCVAASYAKLVALSGAVRQKLLALQGQAQSGYLLERVVIRLASPDLKEREVDLYRRAYALQIYYQED